MKLPKHLIDALGADPANCVIPLGENPRLDRSAVKAQRAASNGSKSAWAMPKRVLTAVSRMLFRGHRGAIPAKLPPLLSRPGMSEEGWLPLVKDFGRYFRRVAGFPSSLSAEAARRERQGLHGTRTAENAFTRPA